MAEQNYYRLLGLDATASTEEIKRAYRQKAIKYHPDKKPDDKRALEKFRLITEAYNTLIDNELRAKYDRKLINKEDKFRRSGYRDEAKSSKFSEVKRILNTIFSKGDVVEKSKHRHATDGSDIRQGLTITLSEAARGCQKSIKVNYDEISDRYGFNIVVNRTKEIRIKIYPGIEDGTLLKIKGQGASGRNGGSRGDLYVTVQIQPDDLFTLKGNDIYCEVELDFVKALLGTRLKVPTVDGKVELTISPYTQPNRILCIGGKGFPKPDGQGRGDQFVTVKVVFPKKITRKQRKLIEQFYD